MEPRAHRAGLAAAVTLAVVTVAGGWLVRDLVAAQPPAAAPPSPAAVNAADVEPSPRIVYVRPAPTARVIQVTQMASPPPPPVIYQTVPHGDDDGGGDDD